MRQLLVPGVMVGDHACALPWLFVFDGPIAERTAPLGNAGDGMGSCGAIIYFLLLYGFSLLHDAACGLVGDEACLFPIGTANDSRIIGTSERRNENGGMRLLAIIAGLVGVATAAAIISAQEPSAVTDQVDRSKITGSALRSEVVEERSLDLIFAALTSLALTLFNSATSMADSVSSLLLSTRSTSEDCVDGNDNDRSAPECLMQVIAATWTAYHLSLHPARSPRLRIQDPTTTAHFLPGLHEIGNPCTTHSITFYPPAYRSALEDGWVHVGHAHVGLQATTLNLHYRLVSESDTGIAFRQLRTGWRGPDSHDMNEDGGGEGPVVDYLWQADDETDADDVRGGGSPQQFDTNAGLQAVVLLGENQLQAMCVSAGGSQREWDVVSTGVLAFGWGGRPWEFDGHAGSWITGCFIDKGRLK
ncbi:hypothetical protein V495_00985 [Pseudogymnoascus sp. VKM F-4514 (FW-929)]|nr:hypothetical protein V495_00985 [Pseudogymnoascus sp. VKM F-4514 (FW-929)]